MFSWGGVLRDVGAEIRIIVRALMSKTLDRGRPSDGTPANARRVRRFALDGDMVRREEDGAAAMDQATAVYVGVLNERHANDKRMLADALDLEKSLVAVAERISSGSGTSETSPPQSGGR